MKTNEAPILIQTKGETSGQKWVVDHPLMIGRDRGCDIVVNDRQVSRYHVRLQPTKRGIEIEDLGSKNGTMLKGHALSGKVVLMDGDSFLLASVAEFQLVNSDATMPLGEVYPTLQKLMIDYGSRQVWLNNKQVTPPLSAQQFLLLHHLFKVEGNVATRTELIQAVWGEDQAAGVTEQALDALVRRLRERLRESDPSHDYIVTVRGHGVKLNNGSLPGIF